MNMCITMKFLSMYAQDAGGGWIDQHTFTSRTAILQRLNSSRGCTQPPSTVWIWHGAVKMSIQAEDWEHL